MPRKSIGWRIIKARAGRPCLIAIAWKWFHAKRQPHAEAQRKKLLALVRSLEIDTAQLADGAPEDLKQIVEWIDAFPESGPWTGVAQGLRKPDTTPAC